MTITSSLVFVGLIINFVSSIVHTFIIKFVRTIPLVSQRDTMSFQWTCAELHQWKAPWPEQPAGLRARVERLVSVRPQDWRWSVSTLAFRPPSTQTEHCCAAHPHALSAIDGPHSHHIPSTPLAPERALAASMSSDIRRHNRRK